MMAKHPADDRHTAICEWLTANGIDLNTVPRYGDITIRDTATGRVIVYEAFVLDADGRQQLDDRLTNTAMETRTTPLLADPPTWWEPYQKPTRDQLLDALKRVQQLAERWKHTGDRKNGPRQELLQALGEHARTEVP